jgi:peptidoglycan hydrolase CwlO-like protein
MLLPAVAAGQEDDPAARRAEVQQREAQLTGEIDGLRASNDQLVATLSSLNAQLVDQQGKVDAATRAAADASARLDTARHDEQAVRDQLSATEQRLRDLAVSAYMGPPTDRATVVLLGGPMDEMPKRRVLAGVPLERVNDAVNELKRVKAEVERLRRQLQDAEATARRAQADQQARLADLDAAKAQHQSLLDEVAARLDRALAESDELSTEDAALAAQIRAREDELNRQLAVAASETGGSGGVAPSAPGAPASGGPAEPTTSGTPAPAPSATSSPPPAAPPPASPPPAAPPATAPPTTQPPPTTTAPPSRPVQIVPVDTTWVGGIEVASSIAGQLRALLNAASADGLLLSGSGYRNVEDQIQIRREVCGTTDYDIWDKPSWECDPPVARPGRSMHEKGLAIDFTGPNGDLVRTHDSPTFQWLAANAARFGLYNLPSEPWHWSTNGT